MAELLPRYLRILDYNIQTGIISKSFSNYILGSWRHIAPFSGRLENLNQIARLITEFDIVGLQEVDAGSVRTHYINQVKYLAEKGNFPYWQYQRNRNLGKWAQHSNGLLSRICPLSVENYKLPGMIPGRGAIVARFGESQNPLVLVIMHLSLGARARRQQLSFIARLLRDYQHIIVMGDMNCGHYYVEQQSPLKALNLRQVNTLYNTYPSWQPARNIDHILVSDTIAIHEVEVFDAIFSDHLPIGIIISVTQALQQQ